MLVDDTSVVQYIILQCSIQEFFRRGSAWFADLSEQDRLLACGIASFGAVEMWRSPWWLCLAYQQSTTSKTHTYHFAVAATSNCPDMLAGVNFECRTNFVPKTCSLKQQRLWFVHLTLLLMSSNCFDVFFYIVANMCMCKQKCWMVESGQLH